MSFYSGKFARVQVDSSQYLCNVKWSITSRVDELDRYCSTDDGWGMWMGGVVGADVNIEGYWEDNIHEDPPGLVVNHYITLDIWPDFVNLNAKKFTFPKFLISHLTVDAEVRGLVKYTISGKAVSLNEVTTTNYSLPQLARPPRISAD